MEKLKNNLNPKISVIVPVYNCAKFIKKCLDSLKQQTFSNFELIIINDCSTDSSLKIIEDSKFDFQNIKIIDLESNSGVSYARNLGLKHATCDYIFFMDSDDFVDPKFLEVLYGKIAETDADIVCCNYFIVSRKNRTFKRILNYKPGNYSPEKLIKPLIRDTKIHFFVWNKLFKKEIIKENKILFSGRCYEDMLFTLKAFYFSKNILILDDFLYYYRKHRSSLTHFMSFEKIRLYLNSLGSIKNFLVERNIQNEYFHNFVFLVLRFFVSCFYTVPGIYIKSKQEKNIFSYFSEIFHQVKKLISKDK